MPPDFEPGAADPIRWLGRPSNPWSVERAPGSGEQGCGEPMIRPSRFDGLSAPCSSAVAKPRASPPRGARRFRVPDRCALMWVLIPGDGRRGSIAGCRTRTQPGPRHRSRFPLAGCSTNCSGVAGSCACGRCCVRADLRPTNSSPASASWRTDIASPSRCARHATGCRSSSRMSIGSPSPRSVDATRCMRRCSGQALSLPGGGDDGGASGVLLLQVRRVARWMLGTSPLLSGRGAT